MTWKSFQSEAFRLTEQEIERLIPYILSQYRQAIKDIDKDLKNVYSQILSGVKPDDYWNTMLKYDRYNKLIESVTKEYSKYSREVGKITGDAGKIAMSNNFYRAQYSYLWLVPGTDFAFIPDEIIQMSVFGSTEAWKKYSNSIDQKIFGTADLYYPQAGTLSEFLASNRLKELENIQRAITQGLIRGQSYKKTSQAVKDVIGKYLVKDGVVNVTGAMANTIRIVRTETIRIMNEASTANTEKAKSQGIDVVRFWNATLDQKTRPVHARLDDKPENEKGFFETPFGLVRGPGQFSVVGQNIYCRCTTFESVNGSKPILRKGLNVVKFEEELKKAEEEILKKKKKKKLSKSEKEMARSKATTKSREAFNYKNYDQWAKDNGLKQNEFGQYVRSKK